MAPRVKYFVPQGHEEALRAAELSFTTAVAETADRDGPPFKLPGVIITSPLSVTKAALKKLDFQDYEDCRIGNQLYRLAVGHIDSEARISGAYGKKMAKDHDWAFLETYMANAVTDFGTWINRPVDLNIVKGEVVVPVKDTGRMLVVVDGRPPGEPVETTIKKMCGIELETLAYTTEYTAGVGELVYDGDTIIGQIVDDTFYLFLTLSDAILLLVGIRGANVRLFERMLAVVWNTYLARTPRTAPTSSSPDELREAVITWSADAFSSIGTLIEDRRAALETIEAQYRQALIEYRASVVLLSSIQAFPDKIYEYLGDEQMQRSAWEELAAHPYVRSIGIVDKGINLETIPITLVHGGTRYPLGSFVLRLTTNGSLYVWCLDSPHPRRIPHPHIGESGQLCYGNMALTIQHLAEVERDFPRIFHQALELLTEGYDPTTTHHPIHEWPEERPE